MPTPNRLAALSEPDRNRLEGLLVQFDQEWDATRLAEYAERLPCGDPAGRQAGLAELIKVDLERHWQAGQPRRVEQYLELFPPLAEDPQILQELVLAEHEVRRALGETPPPGDLESRFPDLRSSLHAASDSPSDPPTEPARRDTRVPTDTRQNPTGENQSRGPRTEWDALPEQFGRYRLIRRLGMGAMGCVYLAHDTELDRQVALKTPSFRGTGDEEIAQRFLREARAAANLNHRNICPVYDAGTIDGVKYITMAYIDGCSLTATTRQGHPLSEREAATTIRKLALALDYAHRQGVIHRDLKPANILVDSQGEPVIMDFGLARRLNSPEDARMTRAGSLMGTPAYMAPEQITDNREATGPAGDIYSLGVILYELLTGELPFSGPVAAVLVQIVNNDPPSPSALRPDLDSELEAICTKMMARQVDLRFRSMQQVAEQLNEYLLGCATPPPPVSNERGGEVPPEGPAAVDAPEPVGPRKRVISGSSRQANSNSGWIIAGVLLAMLALLGVAGVIFVQTGSGWVRIEVNDPDLRVAINDRELTVTDLQQPRKLPSAVHRLAVRLGQSTVPLGKSFQLKTARYDGDYRLVVRMDDLELVGDRFEIQRGDRRTMSISLVPVNGLSVPVAPPTDRSAGDIPLPAVADAPGRNTDPPYVLYLAAAAVMAAVFLAVIGIVFNAARWSSRTAYSSRSLPK